MKQSLFAVLLVLLLSAPAWAANTNSYPSTLIDQTCTDAKNVPAAYTPGLTTIGGGGVQVASAALVQLTGTSDGFCDNDSRIRTGILTTDTQFGPFRLPAGHNGVLIFLDGNTVTGGSTVYGFYIGFKQPHDGVIQYIANAGTLTGTGDHIIGFGPFVSDGWGGTTEEVFSIVTMPKEFYLSLDTVGGGASAITAELSVMTVER